MAVSHVASTGVLTTATAQGTTSMSVAYPAGVAAGRLAIIFAAVKLSTATFDLPSGWTDFAGMTGGTGASAADLGTTRIQQYVKILDGTESGSVTVTNTGGVSCAGAMSIYSSDTGTFIGATIPTAVAHAAADTTHGTNPTGTGAGGWGGGGLLTGDLVVWSFSNDTDADKALTSPTISTTGVTFGATTHCNQSLSSSGTDCGLNSFETPVTSGGGGVNPPTFGFTSAVSQCGAFAGYAFREGPLVVPPSLALARYLP